MIKQAIIPLAGLGTRLLPLTSVIPKELLPINGRPGIEYIIDECIEAGIKELIFVISKKKEIIKKALISLNAITPNAAEELLKKAEKIEQESNQIVAFTKEIKKNSMEFRLKIIEILWKIVYSDGSSDSYESNLIRRVCGLLYISDRDSGMIKLKIKNSMK